MTIIQYILLAAVIIQLSAAVGVHLGYIGKWLNSFAWFSLAVHSFFTMLVIK